MHFLALHSCLYGYLSCRAGPEMIYHALNPTHFSGALGFSFLVTPAAYANRGIVPMQFRAAASISA